MKRTTTALLVAFLCLDIGYSFYQHYRLPHDGDMAAIILPAFWYSDVLEDPFGWRVLTQGQSYQATNRFFAHWSESVYFKSVPFVLQVFTNPLESTYLASAIAKIVVQVFWIWMLATCVSGTGKVWRSRFIIAAALITPLFQTAGYFERMNIIDNSVTYTFFYALSLACTALFFLPFYRKYVLNEPVKFSIPLYIGLTLLAFVTTFQGPLNTGVVAITCMMVMVSRWWQNFKLHENKSLHSAIDSFLRIPKPILYLFTFIGFLSLYSLYIGTFNSENQDGVTVAERYSRVLTGLNQQLFFGKGYAFGAAYSILFLMIAVNGFILSRSGESGKKILRIYRWVIVFSLIYILLVPLGGYRSYRPYVFAASTFLPVTLLVVFLYAISSWAVLQNVSYRKVYVAALVTVGIIFSLAERPYVDTYKCERSALETIAASPTKHVELNTWCGVMSWTKITDSYASVHVGQMLYYWNVTKEEKTFTTVRQ